MATIDISYSDLTSAASDARDIAKRMDDYSSKITNAISNKFNSLSGSDDSGYISAAARSASRKISDLSTKSSKTLTFASGLDDFVTKAKQADQNVEKKIKSTGQSYVGTRSFWQKVGDWLYDTFCVDLMNSNSLAKLIGDAFKTVADKVSDVVGDIVNWFKYKDGKYVWNIVTTVAGTIAAIASAVVAVLTAGTVLAVIAAAASIIVAAIAIVNGITSVIQNKKALDAYGDGNIGQARYYGNIEGFSDAMEKYDMGDAQTNSSWETVGKVVDTTEAVCEVVIAINGVANLGGVKNEKTGIIDSYDFSKENIWKNIKSSLGINKKRRSVDSETGKLIDYQREKSGYKVKDTWSFSDMFESRKDGTSKSVLEKYLGFGKTDSAFYSRANGFSPSSVKTLEKKFSELSTGKQIAKTVLDTGSVVSTVTSRLETIDALTTTIKNGLSEENDLYSNAKNVLSTLNFSKTVKDLDTIIKPFDKFKKVGETVTS